MKRLLLALVLVAVTSAAQAGNTDDRYPASGRHTTPQTTSTASPVSALLKWLAAKAAPEPAHVSRHQHASARAAAVEPPATVEPAPPATVAAPVVVARTEPPEATSREIHHGGYHSCSTGERIISAYYWEGSHTASGARFDPEAMTAAHRTFAFGTRLTVINPRNGRTVTVTVNDRGPFVKGVTLDLSRGAAKVIGLQGTGAVCMVKA